MGIKLNLLPKEGGRMCLFVHTVGGLSWIYIQTKTLTGMDVHVAPQHRPLFENFEFSNYLNFHTSITSDENENERERFGWRWRRTYFKFPFSWRTTFHKLTLIEDKRSEYSCKCLWLCLYLRCLESESDSQNQDIGIWVLFSTIPFHREKHLLWDCKENHWNEKALFKFIVKLFGRVFCIYMKLR